MRFCVCVSGLFLSTTLFAVSPWFDAMINLKSMSLSALAVIQSTRAFSLNAASVSATRYRPYRHLVPRTRCQHTDTAAARRTRKGDAKQQVTRMEAGAPPGSPSPVLGRGREVSRRERDNLYPKTRGAFLHSRDTPHTRGTPCCCSVIRGTFTSPLWVIQR